MKIALVLLWLTAALGLTALATASRPGSRPIAWLHGIVGLAAFGFVVAAVATTGPLTLAAAMVLGVAAILGIPLFLAGRRGNPVAGRALLAHVLAAIVGIILVALAAAISFGHAG